MNNFTFVNFKLPQLELGCKIIWLVRPAFSPNMYWTCRTHLTTQVKLELNHTNSAQIKHTMHPGTSECTGKPENRKTWKLENFENIKNDPWDMLNNFCLHVYAHKSLFIAENGFFWDSSSSIITLSCEFRCHRAGSQLKISLIKKNISILW